MSKIFGIGLSKTGTNSLTEALKILGYDAIHARREQHIHQHQASTDTPVAARYRKLDKQYPESLFIATTRDLDEWLVSAERHFTRVNLYRHPSKAAVEYAFCRGVLYRTMTFDRQLFIEAYHRHYDGIKEYFEYRNDLLWFNVREGWRPLCKFLDKPIPETDFPWLNKACK